MTDVALRSVKLTANERRALAELAKPVGQRDYSRVHGNTRDALARKGLFGGNGKPGGAITPAGRAELTVPDIFDDLFDKESTVPKKKPPAKSNDAFRPIEFVETTLHDPVRERWEEGDDKSGVRLYCTANPQTHGEENGRWSLQIFAQVKKKRGGVGKHFATNTASMSREDLGWLRDQITATLRRRRGA